MYNIGLRKGQGESPRGGRAARGCTKMAQFDPWHCSVSLTLSRLAWEAAGTTEEVPNTNRKNYEYVISFYYNCCHNASQIILTAYKHILEFVRRTWLSILIEWGTAVISLCLSHLFLFFSLCLSHLFGPHLARLWGYSWLHKWQLYKVIQEVEKYSV